MTCGMILVRKTKMKERRFMPRTGSAPAMIFSSGMTKGVPPKRTFLPT